MNAFLRTLEAHNLDKSLRRAKLTTIQVNLGNICNQSCTHCHIEASFRGRKIMSRPVVDAILSFLARVKIKTLDLTGGAPELNPHFDYFIAKARGLVDEIIVRSNLTVFFEPGKEHLPKTLKDSQVHLICSLPCYTEGNVDRQRGAGVFKKSIKALRLLNKLGYGINKVLALDIVYNPGGAFLPGPQAKLERDYKLHLKKDYQVYFNRLITITNVPIKRFKHQLKAQGKYSQYLKLLEDNFNPGVIPSVMCRNFLSIDYQGKAYDCDFNQSLGWVLKDERNRPLTIGNINTANLKGREIMAGDHCFSCTAGYGSSCQGSLADE